jgi:hypothetical protein
MCAQITAHPLGPAVDTAGGPRHHGADNRLPETVRKFPDDIRILARPPERRSITDVRVAAPAAGVAVRHTSCRVGVEVTRGIQVEFGSASSETLEHATPNVKACYWFEI